MVSVVSCEGYFTGVSEAECGGESVCGGEYGGGE